MKKIELDVTALIEIVKKEHKLFYPVMMYILLQNINLGEEIFFYETGEGHFLKTTFHPDFEVFYKNYIYDCFKEHKEKKIPKGKILVGLYSDKKGNANFLLCPFEEKNRKTILPILINHPVADDFEAVCQKAVFGF